MASVHPRLGIRTGSLVIQLKQIAVSQYYIRIQHVKCSQNQRRQVSNQRNKIPIKMKTPMITHQPAIIIEPVFILAGQSNMAGRCDAAELPAHLFLQQQQGNNDDDPVVEFRMCWDLDRNFGEGCSSQGQFLPLQPQPSPGLNMDIFGPEMALAQSISPRLVDAGVKRAHLIKFALGSTNLHTHWNPTNSVTDGKLSDIGYYPQFLKFCKDSMELLQHNDDDKAAPSSSASIVSRPLSGMFWLQGESDSSKAKTANAYLSNFKNFIQRVRQDLGTPDLPLVVSPVIWNGKKVHVVNEALRQAAKEVQHCYCIEALNQDEFGVQGSDAGVCARHLTAAGLCEIGSRMGRAVPLEWLDRC